MKQISYSLIFLLVLWLCFLCGRKGTEQKPKEIGTTDTMTIVRIDTIVVYKPKPYKVRDTIYLPNPQGPQNPQNPQGGGSVLVQEVKEYRDSTYYAKISGINAYLEEIRVYPRTEYKYITNTEIIREKPKKWGLGVQAGYGIGRNGLQPYIGVGISYNLIRF